MAFFSNDSIEITEEEASEWMKHLKKDVSDLENLRPVYPLDVSFDFARMKEGFEQISNALHLKSPICDPSDYFLTTGVKGTKCWNIEIDGNSETAFNRAKANLLHVRIEGITVMEDCSLQSLISSGKEKGLGRKSSDMPLRDTRCCRQHSGRGQKGLCWP